jgi:alpha-L-rhamnosidase
MSKSLLALLVLASILLPKGCTNDRLGEGELLVQHLKCEYLSEPKGVEHSQPLLSWELDAPGKKDVLQSAYRILVYESNNIPEKDKKPYWDSGKIKSGQSVNVAYAGKPLQSAKKYYWKVQLEDNSGAQSAFSKWASFETGILHEGEWKAKWIHGPTADTSNCPFLRYEFDLEKAPLFAPGYVASVGYHELYVNGKKVGDAVLTPSVSDLRNRALYNSYDLSDYLKKGKNSLVIWLASGWADFSDGNPKVDFEVDIRPICKAQFKVGSELWIYTDQSWRFAPSSTYHLGRWKNSDFGGDLIDDSGRDIAWTQSPVDGSQWNPVDVVDCSLELSSDFLEPNRLLRKRKALSVRKTGERSYQFRMDSIYTGWMEVRLRGEPGQRISISASSYPDKVVEFNQTNVLILDDRGEGVFKNRFSYHQVEYITIAGIDYQPELSDVAGYQVNNDRERYGAFVCSSALLNQIYSNTCYTYESLSTGGMSVDCPHRERLGYGGDGHSSLDIALDAYASFPFLSKWARDWVDIQDESGRINHTAPTLGGGGGPAWSGFILTLPWEVYLNYGDTRILETTFTAAQKWLSYLEAHINERGLLDVLTAEDWEYAGGDRWLFLGDWANPHGNEESYSKEASLFNNCYYVYVLKIAADIARILAMEEKAGAYLERAAKITDAVNRTYYDPVNSTYIDSKQTHLVLPLVAGMVPEPDIQKVEEKLREEILVNQKGHFDTGIHGTYFLSKYLTEKGKHELMQTLMTQTSYPSFGEMISRGEITWPEYWHPVNSRVHGCLNGMGGWFQRGILGIQLDPDTPGYKHFLIKPALIDSLLWAKGYHRSPYGPIQVSWEKDKTSFTLQLDVPENTRATVVMPGKKQEEQFLDVGSGKHRFVSSIESYALSP